MLNTESLRSKLRDRTGTMPIADLGIVHQGKIGYANCSTSTGIEHWQGMYFVWISVIHQKNRAGRHTNIIGGLTAERPRKTWITYLRI